MYGMYDVSCIWEQQIKVARKWFINWSYIIYSFDAPTTNNILFINVFQM